MSEPGLRERLRAAADPGGRRVDLDAVVRRATRKRRRRLLATVLSFVVTGGVITAATAYVRAPDGAHAPVAPVVPAVDRSYDLSCERPEFPEAVFPEANVSAPPNAERGDRPADRALARWLASGDEAARIVPPTGWRRVRDDGRQAIYVHGSLPVFYALVMLERSGSEWKWVGSGLSCEARRVVPGLELVPWLLPWNVAVGPNSDRLSIEYLDDDVCVTDPDRLPTVAERLDHIEVAETATSVTITVFLRPFPTDPGAEVCLETALHPLDERGQVDVPLDAPLGDRELIDGSKPTG
jgi:hypothetical protein